MGAQVPRSVLQDYPPNTQTRVSWFAQKVYNIKCRLRMSFSSTTTWNHAGVDADGKIRAAGLCSGNQDDAYGFDMETVKSGMSQRTTMLGNIVVDGYTVNILNKWDHAGGDGDLVLDYEKPTQATATRKFPFGFGKKVSQVSGKPTSQPFFKLPTPPPVIVTGRPHGQKKSRLAEVASTKDGHIPDILPANHTTLPESIPLAPASSELNDDKKLTPGLANFVNTNTSYDPTPIPKPHAHPTPYISPTAAAACSSISLNRHRQAQRPTCAPITSSSSNSSDSDGSYVTAVSQFVQTLQELPSSSASTSTAPTPNSDDLRHLKGKAREMKWSRNRPLSLTLPLGILPTKSIAVRPPTLNLDLSNAPNVLYDSGHTEGMQERADVKGKGKMKPWQADDEEAIDTDDDKASTISEPTPGLGKGYYQDYFSSEVTDVKTQLHGVPFPTLQSLPPSSFAGTSFRPPDSSASSSSGAVSGPSCPGARTSLGIESKPSIYRHTSLSLLDFRRPSEGDPSHQSASRVLQPTADDVDTTPPSTRAKRKQRISKPPPYLAVVEVRRTEPKEIYLPRPSSRRRHSLPTFNSTTDPPPYPSLFAHRQFRIEPRDEEGREHLPKYTNHIFMCGVVPMKMEFLSAKASIPAANRRWRKVVCVLEGTSFKVYKRQPVGVHGTIIGDWWRSRRARAARNSAGPSTSSANGPLGHRTYGTSESPNSVPTRSRLGHLASLFHPERPDVDSGSECASHPRSTSPGSAHTPQPFPSPASASNNSSEHVTGSSSAEGLQYLSAPNATSLTASLADSQPSPSRPDTPDSTSSHEYPFQTPITIVGIGTAGRTGPPQLPAEAGELLREYSTQHAVSGLAYDYTKRKNVIRVRLEGEQFLMQTSSMFELVAWAEALQAATDVSLDLDERPMPRGPRFSRGRRRPPPRPRRVETPLPEVSQHTSISTDTT